MEKPRVSCIYCIECKETNRKYVGQAIDINDRYQEHLFGMRNKKHHNKDIQFDIDKFGIDNFDFYILEYCPENQLDEKENYWIDFYDTFHNGYNLKQGNNHQIVKKKNKRKPVENIRDVIHRYVPNTDKRKSIRDAFLYAFHTDNLKDRSSIDEFRSAMGEYMIDVTEHNMEILPAYKYPDGWIDEDGNREAYSYYCPNINQINEFISKNGLRLFLKENKSIFGNISWEICSLDFNNE